MAIQALKKRIFDSAPAVDFWSARVVHETSEQITVRQDLLEPLANSMDYGVMITVSTNGGFGYAATPDLSEAGIKSAFSAARAWAEKSAKHSIINFKEIEIPPHSGKYQSTVKKPWELLSLSQKIDLLTNASRRLKVDPRITDWEASLCYTKVVQNFFASNGSDIEQEFHFLVPGLSATANEGSNTQTRSLGGMRAHCQQAGLEVLDEIKYFEMSEQVANEAIELLLAPNCPSNVMDVVLAPDQMMLQIHESIGHPLELDRILGDERNYAGTSFVTLDMFGSYQYGSELLNITFDPTIVNQLATYKYDDEGLLAEKTSIIKDGILMRPLGAGISQARTSLQGVANSRASSWNRAPIDRMANLNLEPMNSSFNDIISSVDKGIFMKSNISWSIDDSRNKFQFGCEWGQLIENGKLTKVVRNPNYRGVSATFWRNLKMVGNSETRQVFGTPYCGKGEPNQCIRVGHASPICLFSSVDVFGGE